MEVVNILLLGRGVNVRDTLAGGFTVLHLASLGGQKPIVESLLQNEGIDVNAREPELRATALHLAWSANRVEIVKLLLRKDGIDAHSTALHLASEKGFDEVVKVLLQKDGIDVNARGRRHGSTHCLYEW